MRLIDLDQLEHWRSQLADYPAVLRSLNEIENCDGDVEDAAISLAIQAGLEPDHSQDWLLSLAKRFRSPICRCVANAGSVPDLIELIRHLATTNACPALLALPVALAAQAEGLERFCEAVQLEADLSPGQN